MIENIASTFETTSQGSKRTRSDSMIKSLFINRKSLFGIVVFAIFAGIGILGPFLAPYSTNYIGAAAFLPPSFAHLLGTDYIGHDVLSWYLVGTGTSLYVGATVALFTVFLGAFVGLASGYYGGIIDSASMRAVDILLILPGFPLLVILSAYLPPTNTTTIVILSVLGWPFMSRVIRSQVLSLKERPFIKAAILSGMPGRNILFKEIFKHVLPLIIINAVYIMVGAIVAQAGLAFFGLGDLRSVNWGTSLYWAQATDAVIDNAWWWILPPGISIAILGIAANLFGNGLTEIFGERAGEV